MLRIRIVYVLAFAVAGVLTVLWQTAFAARTERLNLELEQALQRQDADAVRSLLSRGAGSPTRDWTRGLRWAVDHDETEIARALLDRRADPNAVYIDRGTTPLVEASVRQNVPLMQALMAHGAKPNGCAPQTGEERGGANHAQQTPLIAAIREHDGEAVNALLAGRASVDAEDGRGEIPLIDAVGWRYALDRLLERGANVNGRDRPGGTALLEAIEGSDTDAVRTLLAHGADPNAKQGWTESTPLMKTRTLPILELLLHYGADIRARDRWGMTVLHETSDELIRRLVTAGAEVDARDSDGQTPYMLTAEKGNLDRLKLLLTCGANPCLEDPKGRDARQLAKLYYHPGTETTWNLTTGKPWTRNYPCSPTELARFLEQACANHKASRRASNVPR